MNKKILWLTYILYLLVSGLTMTRHELWSDEVHSWNLAKGSDTYPELIHNRRFEGHPPGWHTILWSITKVTHNVAWMQVVQWIIAALTIFLLLFYAPFPPGIRILLCFGYFFLFEYGIMSRNYEVGVLLAFCVCLVLHKEFRYKLPLYYLLLFLLSNIHLLALILAGSIHLYFLLSELEKGKKKALLFHILAGALILLPAVFFIYPPPDSTTNIGFFVDRWTPHQLLTTADAPLRSFLPMPAWWKYHFWNTQFLIEAENSHHLFKFINPLLSLVFIAGALFTLRKSRKASILFGANLLLNLLVSVTAFPLHDTRYSGFIFIGFIIALWLYCYEIPLFFPNHRWVYALLITQAIAGLFITIRDIQLPFSNLSRISELIKETPAGERLVTDYWTMNSFVAYTDKPAYCVDMQRELSFVLWGPDMTALHKNKNRYTSGLQHLFQDTTLSSVYMISMGSPPMLAETDVQLPKEFHLSLLDSRQGAIETGGDLYLYKITRKDHP